VPLSQKDHNVWLEITWTVIPSILVMLMFWYGWEGYLSLRRVPDNAIPVQGNARMWSWLFTYENGKTSDKLYVPVGQPVNVRLSSEDVLHSFYVPAFRVKRDCVPGMETYAWFVAEEPGSYDLFCAEYCGVAHADMITTVEAVPAAEFAGWLAEKPSAAAAGQGLLQKHGCLGCHSLDGSPMVGPSFQGIGGRQVTVVVNGESRTLTSDRDYLEKAIIDPNVEIVEGFPPAMPSYAGKIPEEDMTGILDYLLNLKAGGQSGEETTENQSEEAEQTEEKAAVEEAAAPEQPASPAERGEALASTNGCLGCHSVDGSKRVGPTLKGFWGSERIVTRDGQETSLVADDDYLRKALLEPSIEVLQGYPPAMPPYPGLSDADIQDLRAWLETLK
jgi:cytochrome c oxidase subunit 2